MTREDNELIRIHTMNVAIAMAEYDKLLHTIDYVGYLSYHNQHAVDFYRLKFDEAMSNLHASTFDVIQMSRRIDEKNGWNYHDNQLGET